MSLERLQLPYLTTAQRELITPNARDILFDTDENKIYIGNGVTPGGIELGAATFNAPLYDRFISTGLLFGGRLSINADPAFFDIEESILLFVDNSVNPPLTDIQTFAAQLKVAPTYLATNTWEQVGINVAGEFVFKPDDVFSVEEKRTIVSIGECIHPDMATIDIVRSAPEFMGNKALQLTDFLDSRGIFNIRGNVYSAGGSLTLHKTIGYSFFNNIAYADNIDNPNIKESPAYTITPVPIYYYYQDGAGDWINDNEIVTNVDPNHYDDGTGTLHDVTAGYWTIQVIALYPHYDSHDVQYGQQEYSLLEAAKAALRDRVEINPYNQWDTFRCWLIVKQGATNLTNAAQAVFVEAPRIPISDLMTGSNAFPGIITINGEAGSEVIISAADVPVTPAGSITQENVQAALEEISAANDAVLLQNTECHGSGVISGGTIVPTDPPNTNFMILAYSAYVSDGETFISRVYSPYPITDLITLYDGLNAICVNKDNEIVILNEEPDFTEYCLFGVIYTAAGNTILAGIVNTPAFTSNIANRVTRFVSKAIHALVEEGCALSEGATPLKLSAAEGSVTINLQSYDVGAETSFYKMFYCTDYFWTISFTNPNAVEPGYYNDMTKPYLTAIVAVPAGKWTKSLVYRLPDGTMYWLYPQTYYDTEDEAKAAAIPTMPPNVEIISIFLATIVCKENDASIGTRIIDVRPYLPRVFGYGAATAGVSLSHSALTGLSADDHLQYYNETRGDARYAVLANGVTSGDSHDHTGGAGAQIDHTGLSNIGTNTHSQIDTFISSGVPAFETSTSNIKMDGAVSVGALGTVPRADHIHASDTSRAAVAQTMNIGTTAVAINRGSGALVLTGITSIDGAAATCSGNAATATTLQNVATPLSGQRIFYNGTNWLNALDSFTSGVGTSGITGSTNYALFPSAQDTITLAIGTYIVDISFSILVATSTVSSVCNLNMRGAGTAVGSMTWFGTGCITLNGTTTNHRVAATALGTNIAVTVASAVSGRVYTAQGRGILKVTTGGTIIPAYQWGSTLTSGAVTLYAENLCHIQQISNSGTTVAQGGWA